MAETTFTVKIAVQQDGSISLIDQAGQKIASLGQAASTATGGLGTLADGTQAVGTAAQSAGSQMGDAGNKASEFGSKAGSASAGLSSMDVALLRIKNAIDIAKTAFEVGAYAYHEFFGGIVDRAGSLDDLSHKIGVAGSTLSQFKLAAEASGTSVEGLGTGLKFLSKNLVEAASGGNEASTSLAAGFKVLGVDAKSALGDTNGALLTLADQFKAMPDSAEKTTLAMELFGKAGTDLIPFLNQGSEGIQKMTALNDALGLSLTDKTIAALDNLGDNLQTLGSVSEGVFTQLAAGAAPVLDELTNQLVRVAENAGIGSGTLQEWGLSAARYIAGGVAKALRSLADFATDVQNVGIGTALFNAFSGAIESVVSLMFVAGKKFASAVLSSFASSLLETSSVVVGAFDFITNASADASRAATTLGTEADQALATIRAGSGSTTPAVSGFATTLNSAADAADVLANATGGVRDNYVTLAPTATAAADAHGKLDTSTTKAGKALAALAGPTDAQKAAATEAAAAADKLSQAMEKLSAQSTEIATKQGIYDAYISGAINYETALIALDTAQIGGKEATENLTVATEAEKVAREQGAAALTQQTAELMNKNAETSAEVAALEAAAAAGETYESAQLGITAAVIEYQAEQKLAAGYTAEQVAAWAEAQMQVANLAASVTSYTQALKDNSEAASLEKQIATWEQVRTGVMSVAAAQRQLAIDAKVAGGSTVEAATKLVDLAEAAKTGAEAAANAYVNMGDIIEGAFSQSFDAVISGTRDFGDALEGIGLSIGKQMFSAMLKSKMEDFDPAVKANFLDLGGFGTGTFADMFTQAADFGRKALGAVGFDVAPPSGGGGNSTTNPSSPDFIGPPAPPGKSGGGGMMSDFMAGVGYGQVGKMIGQTFFGEATSGSEGVDRAISGLTMVTSGLANMIPIIGPLLSAITGLIGSQLPRLFAFMVGVTTKGTGQRREGESILDKSSTFSALQKKDKLGDYTRGTNDTRGLEDNYRTGVATAVERGMAEGEANGLKGAGEGIFSVLFKGDGDKMVNGAMDMGRGMAEFLSRGLAEGMTYDEMMASLRELARENEITFSDALTGVTKFGAGAMEQFGKIGHADWGAQEFADSVYGISEVFANDFPAGVNLAAIALQTMEKDGSKAFANLDSGTNAWILSVANDAEAFKTVFADLAIKGFTIDTVEFENTLADITASAEFVGANIGSLLSAPTLAQGMQGIGDALKGEITAALGDNMLGDLFDTTGIATAFQGLFSNIRQLKDGSMNSDEFMGGMAEAIASGKANLEEYLPRIKAMREAFAEVKAAVDEAFKPTREEQTQIENKTVNDSLGSSAGAALSSVLSGGDVASAVQAFSAGFKTSISQSVMEGLQSALIQAATTEGALGGMMASFKEQTAAAMADGVLTGQEKADLSAMAGQIKDTAAATASALEPIVGAVAEVGASLIDSTSQASAQLAEMQGKVQSAFSGAVGAAFSAIGEGKSVADAQAAFAESFKKSIASSVAEGLQEALVNSAVMEGALGGLMSQFKDATAAAMSDGVITASEQANLAAMAGQIKTAGDAAAAALAPVVGAVAAITAGTTSAAGDVTFNVASQEQGYATAADTAIGKAATSASTTVATASTSAATTISTALEGAGQAMATGTTSSGAAYAGAVGAAATSASGAIAGASTEAGATISGAIAMTGALLAGSATELTGATQGAVGAAALAATEAQSLSEELRQASSDSAATTTAGYADAAQLASDALGLAGQALSGDVAAASESLKVALTSVLGTGDAISALAPDAAYGIGQSLADVRDKVAPAMQTQIDALIGSLSDASLTPEESAKLQTMVGSLGSLGSSLTPEMASQTTAMLEAVGSMGGALDPEAAAKTKEALGSLSLLGGSVDPGAMAAVGGALAGLGAIGTSIDPEAAARTADALSSIAVIGTAVDPAAMDALGGALAGIGTIGTSLSPELAAQTAAALGSVGALGESIDPAVMAAVGDTLAGLGTIGTALPSELASQVAAAFGSVGALGESIDPAAMESLSGALSGLGTIGTSLSPDLAAQVAATLGSVGSLGSEIDPAMMDATKSALASLSTIGTDIDPAMMEATRSALAGVGAIGDSITAETAAKAAAALGSLSAIGTTVDPTAMAAVSVAMTGLGAIGTALPPELAAQVSTALGSVGALGESIDPAMMEATQSALSSLATIGSDIDPSMMDAVGGVLSGLSDAAAGMPDPAAVVTTMKALGDAALSSSQASDLAGTMQALGSAALDAGQAADMSATLQAFAASSSEGASNTTAVIEAFGGIDAGMSGSIKSSLESLVSSGVAEGATALSESLGGDGPAAIVSGLSTLQSQLDAGTLSSLTTPLTEALSSVVSPADELQSALQSLYDPTRNVTSGMSDLGSAVASAVDTINGAISGLATAGGVPAAATGGQFASGSAVVGEAGKPELVTASQGGGFSVTPLSWDQAHSLMGSGTAGFASGGRVGMGRGGADLPVAPPGTGGGGGNNPGPRYTPNAEGAEFADFTSAITDAFRAGLEGSKGFIEDFSDTINESVRTQLVDAIMQGFSEGPAIQKYADAIDVLITKAQTLAGNGELTAASLGDIQAQIKANTDAIGEQADQLDEILEPLRQASAISTAFSEGLDFSGALKSLAANPSDLEAFGKSIDQTVNDAVLNGAIQGLLASGPIQDAVKKFGDSMNDAMATALEDGVITAEESDALHDMAVSGSAEMKTAMEALGPVLSALGIDLGDAMTEGINRATEVMKSASSAMDPFAALGEGETQFTNFTQGIKDQVYTNIKDGLVQAFIDSAVTNGLLAGPMMAIQAIFDQIGQKQLTTAEANAALAEQTALINGSLNDPAFKSAFDTTMASISSIGQGLGQTSQRVESAASTAASSAQTVTDASKDVCSGKCELEKQTTQLGNAAANTFGRTASVSIEEMLPKLALGGLVTKKTMAVVGEAGPELVIPTKELAAAASAIQRVDFGSARESATAGMASLMAAMPTSLADSLSGAMTDQQDAMIEKIKQAASAGGGTAGSISDALASAMDSLTGGGDIGAIAEQLKQGMSGGDIGAIAEKMKATMADAGGSMTDMQSILAKMSGSLGAILPGAAVSDEAAAQAADAMKATMAGTGGSLTDIADTLSGLSTSLTATATTTNAAMAQRLAEVASATVEKPVAPTPALDIERVVAGTMNTVDAIKDLEYRLDKLSNAILAQPTEVIVQMDRETLMRAMAKADRFKKKARYGVQA